MTMLQNVPTSTTASVPAAALLQAIAGINGMVDEDEERPTPAAAQEESEGEEEDEPDDAIKASLLNLASQLRMVATTNPAVQS